VHYSVQGNHIHLIAEAVDRRALTRGMMGLVIRVALRSNRARGRKGRVFSERYHARQLKTPLEVRRALLYVLRNDRRHQPHGAWSLPAWHFDSCSSASEFDGWRESELLYVALQRERERRGSKGAEATTAPASGFLLRVAWRRHGLLRLDEAPGRE